MIDTQPQVERHQTLQEINVLVNYTDEKKQTGDKIIWNLFHIILIATYHSYIQSVSEIMEVQVVVWFDDSMCRNKSEKKE